MSVMDMRPPAGIYHVVKEAQCGSRYEVCDGKSLCAPSQGAVLATNGTESLGDDPTLLGWTALGPHRKC